MAAMGTSRSPIVISDDDEPVATATTTQRRQQPAEESGGNDAEISRPDWLHPSLVMGVETKCSDGTVLWKYTCPVGGFIFYAKSEAEDYVSFGAMERAICAEATLHDMTTLQGKYNWFRAYPGYVLEIRAGGKNMSKMFKFFANPRTGVRIASKKDFMNYVRKGVIPEGTNVECNTSGEDNIIAQLEFQKINELPPGWVKETVFRHSISGTRTYQIYTDPVNQKVYRSLTAAIKYFRSREEEGSHKPHRSVTDMYFFDKCTDMLPCLAKRLKNEGTEDDNHQNSQRMKCGTSAGVDQTQGNETKTENKRDKDAMTTDTSKPSRPRGRPRKS